MRRFTHFAFALGLLFSMQFGASAQNPGLVKDINPGPTGFFENQGHTVFEIAGSAIFFMANDGIHGNELWKSDGTANGTVLVYDLYPGSANGMTYKATNCNGLLYLSADDGSVGREPYRSNGSLTAPILVKNIYADTKKEKQHSNPAYFAAANGLVYFGATVARHRPNRTNQLMIEERELFRSDGTAAGTYIVKDLDPHGVFGTYPICMINWNNILYFFAYVEGYSIYDPFISTTFGRLLCRSDGTAAGTYYLNTVSEANWEYTSNPTPSGSYLYYRAKTAAEGMELWRTNGTSAGTSLVADINPTGDCNPRFLTDWNGTLYFTATDGAKGRELWKTNGTGATLVKDINPNAGDGNPEHLTVFNGALYFTAVGPDGTRQLWKSDGTDIGTTLVRVINSAGDCAPMDNTSSFHYKNNQFQIVGEYLYFVADDGAHGLELWRSDGTNGGTVMVKDANTAGGSQIKGLTALGGKLFYSAELPATGRELWLYDPALPVSKGNMYIAPTSSDVQFDANHPNPFIGVTTLSVSVPEESVISLHVYDALGRKVATLANNLDMAGRRSFTWNATGFAPGLYVCRLEVAGRIFSRTMLLGN